MTRKTGTGLLGTALAVLMVGQTASEVMACPNCKEAVSTSTSELGNMSRGYNWSVGFMLAVPFSMIGTGAFMIHRAAKRGLLPEL